jgi:signal transduction histidine kinase
MTTTSIWLAGVAIVSVAILITMLAILRKLSASAQNKQLELISRALFVIDDGQKRIEKALREDLTQSLSKQGRELREEVSGTLERRLGESARLVSA